MPLHIGLVVVRGVTIGQRQRWRAVCRRWPKYRRAQIPTETLWRIFFRCFEDMRQREHTARNEYKQRMHRVGAIASGSIFRAVYDIERNVHRTSANERAVVNEELMR